MKDSKRNRTAEANARKFKYCQQKPVSKYAAKQAQNHEAKS